MQSPAIHRAPNFYSMYKMKTHGVPEAHAPLVRACRWSAGVIMYTLLAGSPPFWHRKQMLMLRMILAGEYNFLSPEWEDRSDTVKDLVVPVQ